MSAGIRYVDSVDWVELWHSDKQSMLNCMIRNMTADLEAGYNYFGNSITSQREAIEAYNVKMDKEIVGFAAMSDDRAVNRWCTEGSSFCQVTANNKANYCLHTLTF